MIQHIQYLITTIDVRKKKHTDPHTASPLFLFTYRAWVIVAFALHNPVSYKYVP